MQTQTTEKTANGMFDLKSLEQIGNGSSRRVYRLDDKVLKVAKNAKGLEQNSCAGDYLLINEGILPEKHGEGLDYIITDYVPRNDKVLRQWLKPLQDMCQFSCYKPKSQDTLEKMGLGMFLNYSVLWGDVKAYRNWGTNSKGKHVLIDEGAMNDGIHYFSIPAEWAVEAWNEVKRERRSK